MNILRVFTDDKGQFGNPVGIIVDEDKLISDSRRQKMAKKSGFSEVVFINSLTERNISIFSPQHQIPFAGHAAIGAIAFLSEIIEEPIKEIISMNVHFPTWQEKNNIWIQASLDSLPDWNLQQLNSHSDVEKTSQSQALQFQHCLVWAWKNIYDNQVRARTFASDWGIPEDEANGSGSMLLAHQLHQELTIHHGLGSVIHAKPISDRSVAVGGLVVNSSD